MTSLAKNVTGHFCEWVWQPLSLKAATPSGALGKTQYQFREYTAGDVCLRLLGGHSLIMVLGQDKFSQRKIARIKMGPEALLGTYYQAPTYNHDIQFTL